MASDVKRLLEDVELIRYSTTQGTNAICERKGPKLGLVLDTGSTALPGALRDHDPEVYDALVSDRVSFLDPAVLGTAEAEVEIVNFRMTARGRLYDAPPIAPAGEPADMPAPVGRRPVWFDSAGAVETPVYRREALKPGLVFEGPAIVDQMDATTPVFPGDRVEVRPDGSLLIALKE